MAEEHHPEIPPPEASLPEISHPTAGGSLELENIVNAAERVWSGIKQLPRVANDLGKVLTGAAMVGTGALGMYYLIGGGALVDAVIMGSAFIVGDYIKKKKNNVKMTYGAILRQCLKGALIGGLLGIYYDTVVHHIANPWLRGASILPIFPPYVYADRLLEHVLGGEKFDLKVTNKDLLKALMYMGPLAMLNASVIPRTFNIPYGATLSTFYAYMVAGNNKPEQHTAPHAQPRPQITPEMLQALQQGA